MTEIEKIKQMIESLQGYTEEEILRDHVATLDEIDARVWCVRMHDQFEFKGKPDGKHETDMPDNYPDNCWKVWRKKPNKYGVFKITTKPTRSIDAQKTLEVEGWRIQVWEAFPDQWRCEIWKNDPPTVLQTKYLPTEALVRLYCWLCIFEWEEQNNE